MTEPTTASPVLGDAPPEARVVGRIFINYSRKDVAFIRRLDAYLREHGLEPVVGYERNPGPEFERALREQVDQCAAVVVVVSPTSSRSLWVRRAIEYALYHNKPVVPLLLRGNPHPLLGNHHHEGVHDGQMPSAVLVERLQSLVSHVGVGTDEEAPLARLYGQVADIRERLWATAGSSLLVAAGAWLGWVATGRWSGSLQDRYGAAAGMAVLIIALAVAKRWPMVTAATKWVAVVMSAFLVGATVVLLWQIWVRHQDIGWAPPTAAAVGAAAWPVSSLWLARILPGEAAIKLAATLHKLVGRRAAVTYWLSSGKPPSVFGPLLADHVRGTRTKDAYFRYALAASSTVIFVDTSGMTDHPAFFAKATELAAWVRRIRGRPHGSINVAATFVAIDDKVPAVAVTTVGDVDIMRVSTARFARTVWPLLDRGYPWLYMPLLAALLTRVTIVPRWRRWYLRAKAWLGFG